MDVTTNAASKFEQREGPVARAIESRTSKLPSDIFLWAAGASIIGSLALQVAQSQRLRRIGVPTRRGQMSLFIGQWAPTFLLLGIYNKLVKVAGSDRVSP